MNADNIGNSKREIESAFLMDLTDEMWKGFIKYWWIILVFLSLLSSIFYFHARHEFVPQYTSTATFTVEANTGTSSGNTSSYNTTMARQIGTVFPYLLKSNAMSRMVAEDLGLSSVPANIETETLQDTNMVTLKVTSGDPYLSYDILQSLTKNYGSVAEYVLGNVTLNLVDGSGVDTWPSNMISFRRQALKGFLIGAGIVFLLLYLYAVTRKTVKKEKDLKKVVNVPCLAVLPEVKLKKRSNMDTKILLDQKHVPSFFSESVRNLRTKLVQDMKDHQTDSILVTSALAGEGKSTVAANMAIVLAQRGYRVLLIDGDLRKPALAETIGLKKREKGFREFLSGDASLKEVIVPYGNGLTLAIIPGGKPADNAPSLLNEEKMGVLLEAIREGTDIMIIDSPPCAVVADAAVYARHVDGAVMVIRQDYAKFNDIITGVELLNDSKLRLIGCVLNRFVAGVTRSGYSYGYGYGYGYGRYGYGYGYGRYGGYSEDGEKGEVVDVKPMNAQTEGSVLDASEKNKEETERSPSGDGI